MTRTGKTVELVECWICEHTRKDERCLGFARGCIDFEEAGIEDCKETMNQIASMIYKYENLNN